MTDSNDSQAVAALLTRAQKIATEKFPCSDPAAKTFVAYAPGRVNLIGEHTDYEEGFVCPFAVNLGTLVRLVRRPPVVGAARFRFYSEQFEGQVEFDRLPEHPVTTEKDLWVNYILGTIRCFHELSPTKLATWFECVEGDGAECVDCVVVANLPMGGGLSSSASLEMAVVKAMEAISGVALSSGEAMEKVAQRAEHEWAHVPCGLMDQAVASLGKQNFALLFDCRSKTGQAASLPSNKISVIVFDSGVKHSLVSGEYKARRDNCAEAVEQLSKVKPIKRLRDVASLD
eukprot:Selendium_serpulae@DN9015_c0_g1_i1.p1